MSKPDDHDEIRRQLSRRLSLLFGDERAAATSDELDRLAAAVRRVRRQPLDQFAGLESEDHDQ
jgi:hypothetical protein